MGKLHLGLTTLVSDKQQIRLTIDDALLFEAASFGRLLRHISAGEKSVDQRCFAAIRRAKYAQLQIGHATTQCPLLRVDKRFLDVNDGIFDPLLQIKVGDHLDVVVYGVDVGMDALEALYFFAYEETVGYLVLKVYF
jgi:hypothetical protein